jgi:hypothetical protein
VVLHCPLIAQKSHNLLVFSYNYHDFPPSHFLSTYPTQGIYPFTDLNPSSIPFFYQGLFGTGNQEFLYWETQGFSFLGKLPEKQQQSLVVTVQLTHEFTFQAHQLVYSIFFSKYTLEII